MITVTDNAKSKLLDLIKESKYDDSYFLRVGVIGKGCAGFSYKLEFDNKIMDGDEITEDNGIKIVCDMKSLLYIFGTELDFSSGLNGRGFVWNNPNSTRNCGCGNSFSV